MAKISSFHNFIVNPRRFNCSSVGDTTLILRDYRGKVGYTIETDTVFEADRMVGWTDLQWDAWLLQQKLNGITNLTK